MSEQPLLLLLLYSSAIVLVSVFGGSLPQRVRMTHTRTQLAMSLVSGLMLGVAFFHLLPHAVVMGADEGALDSAMAWLVAGLVAMLLLLRMFHFHQPDMALQALATSACAHQHGHEHEHGHAHEHTHEPLPAQSEPLLAGPPAATQGGSARGWLGVAMGLGMHSLIDGVALGAAVGGTLAHEGGLLGLGVFLAILLHKPLDAMSITAIMHGSGSPLATTRLVNLGFALLCPVAALLFFVFVGGASGAGGAPLAAALAFSAGAFICIALSDLLPEVQFHSHDRIKLTLVFLLGISLSLLIGQLEPEDAHEHSPQQRLPLAPAHEH
jgi:zinc and cadmium transporter